MPKVLVIEDEEAIRSEVMDWLMFEGFTVLGAENGRIGFETAIAERPDIIICDITMPEMDGLQVLLEVRANPIISTVPFIFLTASATHEAQRYGMEMGADDYLTKPFTHQEVIKAVQSRLNKKSQLETQHTSQLGMLTQALNEERSRQILRSRMVAMFSHDFRNPLASILSSATLMQKYNDRLPPERRQMYLSRIEGSVRQLIQMLDDMLLIAEMENDHLQFHPQTVDVGKYLREIVEEFQIVHGEHHTLTFSSDMDRSAEIDPKLFRQLACNLISNAVKYSPVASEVNITLTDKGQGVVLTVKDNGLGIPLEDQARLFVPFHRGSNTQDIEGTGLGLTIVKQAVDLHGGNIEVSSAPQQGSIFTVTLPC